MRAVVYTRQSLDRSGDGLAVARQREDCLKLCEQRGWTVAEVVTDNDVSASNGKPRPGFTRVLAMVDAQDTDVVVVWHVDRLVRKLADLEDVIERCERAGVRLATVSGDIDLSTDAGRLVGRILASVARGEVERKSARQRRAYQQRAEAGRPVQFAHRPFGYRSDKTTPEPAEAKAVADACEMLLSGASIRSIVAHWTAAGLRAPQSDGPLTEVSCREILRNPRIAGLATYRGEIVGTGSWPRLVSEATWRAVCAVLDDRARGPQIRGVRSLLGGLARCTCGAPAHSSTSSRGKPIYRCRELKAPGNRGHIARAAAPIDEYVVKVVISRLSRPDAVDLLDDSTTPDVEALRSQARALRARLEELGREFAVGQLPAAQLRVINASIDTQLQAVNAEIAEAGRVSVLAGLVGADDVRAVWNGLDNDRRRAVIDALFTITLLPPGLGTRAFDPDTVRIDWRQNKHIALKRSETQLLH